MKNDGFCIDDDESEKLVSYSSNISSVCMQFTHQKPLENQTEQEIVNFLVSHVTCDSDIGLMNKINYNYRI